ncbi:hypothetical protein HD554DRAFT_436896 [Boletus coccyginus]|nr:hypothetical protein HD554DRAFT_436896 [Boletus coccyginus]
MRIYHEAGVMYYRGKGILFMYGYGCAACASQVDQRPGGAEKELEVREETLRLVAGLVGPDKVRSQLRRISLRRKFLQEREAPLAAARGMFTLAPTNEVRDTDDL